MRPKSPRTPRSKPFRAQQASVGWYGSGLARITSFKQNVIQQCWALIVFELSLELPTKIATHAHFHSVSLSRNRFTLKEPIVRKPTPIPMSINLRSCASVKLWSPKSPATRASIALEAHDIKQEISLIQTKQQGLSKDKSVSSFLSCAELSLSNDRRVALKIGFVKGSGGVGENRVRRGF